MPRAGILRISAFGDSFTYGAQVPLAETWEKRITGLSPSIELLNYGVGAYGLDQAYLRYDQVGINYHPAVVFIGYMSENIARDVNVFRPFYSSMYGSAIFTKPRFQVKDDQLVLLRNPLASLEDYENFLRNDTEVLPELGKNDYHYQMNCNPGWLDFSPSVRLGKLFWAHLRKNLLHPIFKLDGMYEVNSEAYEVTLRIFDAFYRKILENGAVPIILVFPDVNDQERSRKGKIRRYTPLLEYFRFKGYRFIDTLEALEAYKASHSTADFSVGGWGHYSPLGNAIIGEYILNKLKGWDFLDASKLNQAAQLERRRLAVERR